jgi:hypothetical protein
MSLRISTEHLFDFLNNFVSDVVWTDQNTVGPVATHLAEKPKSVANSTYYTTLLIFRLPYINEVGLVFRTIAKGQSSLQQKLYLDMAEFWLPVTFGRGDNGFGGYAV